ncbi:hypothetical protein DV737_g5279, partial [Chaetothyriales sp. CBS 132003]
MYVDQVHELWQKLTESAASGEATEKYLAAVCNALSVFLTTLLKSQHASVLKSQHASVATSVCFRPTVWLAAYSAAHKTFDKGKTKPGLQLLETLCHLLNEHPDPLAASSLLHDAVKGLVKTVFIGGMQHSVKVACIALSCFIKRTNIVPDLPSLVAASLSEVGVSWAKTLHSYHLPNQDPQHDDSSLHALILALYITIRGLDGRSAALKLLKLLCASLDTIRSPRWGLELAASMFGLFVTQNPDLLTDFAENVLPVILDSRQSWHAFESMLRPVGAECEFEPEYDDATLVLYLIVLRVGRLNTYLDQDAIADCLRQAGVSPSPPFVMPHKVKYSIYLNLFKSANPTLRIQAYNLATASSSSRAPVSPSALPYIAQGLRYLHDDTDSYQRGEILSITRRFLRRLDTCLTGCEEPSAQTGLFDPDTDPPFGPACLSFFQDLQDFVKRELRPAISYPRHILALDTLRILLSLASIRSSDKASLLTPLLNLILDPFEDVREVSSDLCKTLLTISPALRLQVDLWKLTGRVQRVSAKTCRHDHADAAARFYALAYSIQGPQLNASTAIQSLTLHLASAKSLSEDLNQLWYGRAVGEIDRQAASLTRRSAGLPALINSVLSAQDAQFFHTVISDLTLKTRQPVRAADDGGAEPQLPQVHALNCIKDIMHNSRFRAVNEAYLSQLLELGAESMTSGTWAIRNSGLMLLNACMIRLEPNGSASKVSTGHYGSQSTRNEPLKVAIGLLERASTLQQTSLGESEQASGEHIFAALALVRYVGRAEQDSAYLRVLIQGQLASQVWAIRDQAARVLVGRLQVEQSFSPDFLSVWPLPEGWSENGVHGSLLFYRYFMHEHYEHRPMEQMDHVLGTLPHNVRALARRMRPPSSPYTHAALLDLVNDWVAFILKEGGMLSDVDMPLDYLHQVMVGLAGNAYLRARILLSKALIYILFGCELSTLRKFGLIGEPALECLCREMIDYPDEARYVVEAVEGVQPADGLAQWRRIDVLSRIVLDSAVADVRSLAMTALADTLERNGEMAEYFGKAEMAHTRLAISRLVEGGAANERELWNARLRIRPFVTTPEAEGPMLEQNEWMPVLKDMRDAGGDVGEFATRLSAGLALRSAAPGLGTLGRVGLGRPMLTFWSTLYNQLNDDDEEIRAIAGQSVTIVVGSGRQMRPFGWCALAGREEIIRSIWSLYVVPRFHLDLVRALALCHVFGVWGNLDDDGWAGVEGVLVGESVASRLRRMSASVNDLFVEEKQNLYVDELAEVDKWCNVLKGADGHLVTSEFALLQPWLLEGMDEIRKMVQVPEGEDDFPLGPTYHPDLLLLFVRVVSVAAVLTGPEAKTAAADVVTVGASVVAPCTTLTVAYATTVSAAPGQTVTLSSPSFAWPSASSASSWPATTQMRPSLVPLPATVVSTTTATDASTATATDASTTTATDASTTTATDASTTTATDASTTTATDVSTTTATEIEIYLQTATAIYSTWTIALTSASAAPTAQPGSPSKPGQLVYVVSPANGHCAGAAKAWSCWSLAAKIGLVVGVVLAAFVLMLAICWCLKSSNHWIAHDWRWARPAEAGANANVVPTVQEDNNPYGSFHQHDSLNPSTLRTSCGYDGRIQQILWENPELDILITDAGKSAHGGFIEYRIRTGDIEVARRYSEFASLRTALVSLHPTLVIPPIPEKHSMADYAAKPTKAKQDTHIIEQRKRMLAVFLNRCRRMQQVMDDGVWWRFLDPNSSWNEVLHAHPLSSIPKNNLKAPPLDPAKPSAGHQWLPLPAASAKLKSSGATDQLTEAELDPYFVQFEASTRELELLLQGSVDKVNQRTLSHLQKLSSDLEELGARYNGFSLSEQSMAVAAAIERVGQAVDQTYISTGELALALGANFAEPMRESAQFAGVVRTVLRYRVLKRTQSGNFVTNRLFGSFRHAVNGFVDVDPERTRRDQIGKTKESLVQLDQALEVSQKDVQDATQGVIRDLTRFQRDKEDDLQRYMIAYARCQIEWAKKNLETWSEAKEEVDKIVDRHG